MWEPKPHVIGLVAGLVFVASTTTVADRLAATDGAGGVTVEDIAASDDPTDDASPSPAASPSPSDQAAEEDVIALPGDQDRPAASDPGSDDAPGDAPGEEAGDGGDADDTGDGTTEQDQAPDAEDETAPPPQPQQPEASLYDDSAKMRGISSDKLVMCGHAALALGAAFDTSREDLNVYWDMVNDDGGVIGRKVEMSWEDDAYASDQAVRAATSCADKNPFMILGGIGFDQIPGVRDWAEANDELYMHHIAVAPDKNYDYSYSLSPTVELVGEESGNYIVREHSGRKVGVMYRDRENWKPGSDAGTRIMDKAGMDVTSYPVFQNQGVYSQQLNDMRLNDVEVVWIWENALNAAQIINQADDMGYYPTWVVFPFQTTLDILKNPQDHEIEGVSTWSSYAPGGYGGAHSDFKLDQEIAAFEAAYAKYRPDTKPNDILWQVWVGNKILHRMFDDCGRACNRNSFAGMMLSGYQATELPGCKIDFADSRSFGGHHGGFRFFSQETFSASSGQAYRTKDYCAATLR